MIWYNGESSTSMVRVANFFTFQHIYFLVQCSIQYISFCISVKNILRMVIKMYTHHTIFRNTSNINKKNSSHQCQLNMITNLKKGQFTDTLPLVPSPLYNNINSPQLIHAGNIQFMFCLLPLSVTVLISISSRAPCWVLEKSTLV